MTKKKTAMPPIHPGEFLLPHGLNANRLAVAIGVAPNRITGRNFGSTSRPTTTWTWPASR